ncbi:FRG domain-containing protein [Bacillus toyonensis]
MDHTVSSMKELEESLLSLGSEKGEMWYRGEPNVAYKLIPSLFRLLGKGYPHKDIVKKEKEAIEKFKEYYFANDKDVSDWEVLIGMQHYGTKTRLLDWTTSWKIALFFAFCKWDRNQGNCRIWVLNPYLLNELHTGEDTILIPRKTHKFQDYINGNQYFKETVAIEAPEINEKLNKRITAQKGCFTLHYIQNTVDKDKYNLDDELEVTVSSYIGRVNCNKQDILSYVELSSEMYEEVKNYLIKEKITYKEIYPDVEGLSYYINDIVLS